MPIVGNKFTMDPGDCDGSYGHLEDCLDMGRFTDDFDVRKYWVVKLEFLKGLYSPYPSRLSLIGDTQKYQG